MWSHSADGSQVSLLLLIYINDQRITLSSRGLTHEVSFELYSTFEMISQRVELDDKLIVED